VQAVRSALTPLQQQAGDRLQVVENPAWASGQSSSLRQAVRHLKAMATPPEALICLPVDQPWLEAALLRRLLQAWRTGADLAAPQAAGDVEVRGAPALFDCGLFDELLAVEGDKGGRELLRRHHARLVPVPADARSLHDVDSPSDLV
jgi:molybdenum cofactor cytidylyltransferase